MADIPSPATVTTPASGPPLLTRNVSVVTVAGSTGFEKVIVTSALTDTSVAPSSGETAETRGGSHSMGTSTSMTLSMGTSVNATGSRTEKVTVAVKECPLGVSGSILRSQSPRFSADAPGASSGYGELMLYRRRTKSSDSEKAPDKPRTTSSPSLRTLMYSSMVSPH